MSTTPGPWAVSYSLNTIESQKGGTVCRFKPHDDPCSPADMNLIAAAPTLRGALADLVGAIDQFTHFKDADWPELANARLILRKLES